MQRGREKFYRFKAFIDLGVKIIFLLPKNIRKNLFNSSRNIKGNKGLLIRYILLKTLAEYLGDNVSIHDNVYILNPEDIYIGNNVSIHPMTYIQSKGKIKIGDNVSIAHGVTILSENHIFSNINVPIKDQGIDYKMTEIKSNVWIGAKSTILAGITVESGSIIGAGSVVTKKVQNNSIVAGVPAKIINIRA